jgi:transcription termination factor Rho
MTTKAQLESKHLAELHALAAEAGVERYRMLSRAELIEKLADGGSGDAPKAKGERQRGGSGRRGQRDRRPRQDRDEKSRPRAPRGEPIEPRGEPVEPRGAPIEPRGESIQPRGDVQAPRPKRKRRRRWGRRRKGVRVHDLLLPAVPGRQAIVYGDNRAACTVLLREVAAELADASGGPDPIALLIDPGPEELADWRREAPKAEIVAAGKANHAEDALAQARTRAAAGEDVIVLIDSLTRFAESFAGADEARELFDAGGAQAGYANGSLTVVAALERPS